MSRVDRAGRFRCGAFRVWRSAGSARARARGLCGREASQKSVVDVREDVVVVVGPGHPGRLGCMVFAIYMRDKYVDTELMCMLKLSRTWEGDTLSFVSLLCLSTTAVIILFDFLVFICTRLMLARNSRARPAAGRSRRRHG